MTPEQQTIEKGARALCAFNFYGDDSYWDNCAETEAETYKQSWEGSSTSKEEYRKEFCAVLSVVREIVLAEVRKYGGVHGYRPRTAVEIEAALIEVLGGGKS